MKMNVFDKMIRTVKSILIPIAIKIIDLLPVNRKKIVYDNFNGSGFGGNPRYINEYLQTKGKFKSVWLSDGKHEYPSYIIPVRIGSFRAYYEASTAKVRVTNVRNSSFPRKKKSQIHLQTWHASYSYKLIEKDIEAQLSPKYLKMAKYDGSITDAILVDSDMQKCKFQRCFWLNDKAEFLCYGIPRTDQLIKCTNTEEIKCKLLESFGIHADSIFVLYAPTFRDDKSFSGYLTSFDAIIRVLEQKYKKKVVIGVRFHPNAKKEFQQLNYQNILNFTDYSNMQELEVAADVLITDYSSVMFDFAILKKPVFVYASDFNTYSKNRIRVDDYLNMPFPLSYSLDKLLSDMESFELNQYQKNIQSFLSEHPIYCDGRSSERVGEWIIKTINS